MEPADTPFARLARLRGRRSKAAIAAACGVDRTTYSRVERGTARPSGLLWRRIRAELRVGPELADDIEAAWEAGAGHWRREPAE